MDFLHDTVLPGTTGLSTRGTAVASNGPPLRRPKSNGSLLSPLVRLVRDPAGAFEGVAGRFSSDGVADAQGSGDGEDRSRLLYLRMKKATCYDDWRGAAIELDRLEGNDVWKREKESPEYDYGLVEARLKQLDEARLSCDVSRMLFLLRTSLARGLGDMGDLRLYRHSHIGTKALIERYIESAKETLQTLLDLSAKQQGRGPEPRAVLEQMLAARQSFGRSALLLSGGGTFGMNHIGVVKTLWQTRLLPRIVSGASAGSIVCAVLCTRTDEEMPHTLEEFCHGDLAVFEREGEETMLRKAARFLKFGALFDISHLIRVMRNLLGDITFQEAYNRTRRICNITVSSASMFELPRLLNYITAPNVIVWSAVAASCSVPFVFSPAQLLAKDPKTGKQVPWNPSPQHWIDGSVDNDLPMTRLAEMFNVNHFIVSQVNPHVVPFLAREEDSIACEVKDSSSSALAAGSGWLCHMAKLAKGEALHRMHVLAELGIFPNYFTKARSVLSQKYSGDITILPEISYSQFPRVLRNPTPEFMLRAMLGGERATWPKLSRVKNHCAIELALDDAVQQLRTRVVFSPSQVDLRLNAITRPLSHGASTAKRSSSRPPPHPRALEMKHVSRPVRHAFLEPPFVRRRSLTRHHKNPASISSPGVMAPSTDALSSSSYTTDDDEAVESGSDLEPDFEDLFSPHDSPPPSSSVPTLWPTTRQLFPSASQPTTPSVAARSGRAPNAISPASNPLSMTPGKPVSAISEAELTYKRLFHSTKTSQDTSKAVETETKNLPSVLAKATERPPGPAKGLVLDISGTRGMMLRRKKSSNAGMR